MQNSCECGHLPRDHYADTGHCEAFDVVPVLQPTEGNDGTDEWTCHCPQYREDN